MKVQDILFIGVMLLLLLGRKTKFLVLAGIMCLIFSIPLFAQWVFFTAERLTWYAAAFFFIAILIQLARKEQI